MRRSKNRSNRRLLLESLENRLALATLYVAPTGSDSSSGSSTAPWLTLQKAANVAQPGDTVVVRAGNYKGFYMDRDGAAGKPITFRADSGVKITSSNGTTGDGINLEGADYITIEGFTINNMPRAGIRSVTNHHVTILNNSLDSNGVWGIFTAYSDDVRIEGNSASRSVKEHGIYVSNSGDRPIIRNNVTWGNNVCGIHMNGDVEAGNGDGIITGALVEGNKVYDNGRGGGSAINADGVQNSVFQNNLLYNNHASGLSLFKWNGAAGSSGNKVINNTIVNASDARWALNIQNGSTNNTVYNNILYNNSTRGSINISPDSRSGFKSDYNAVMSRFTLDDSNQISLDQWRSSTGQDRNSILATPAQLFANVAANDYHLSATSPALDKGTTTNAPAKDFEGTARPQGAGIDIGADELGASTPTPTPDPDPTPTPTTPTTWYVSATGNDAGAGTATSPWKTLQKAADSVRAGDTVIVRAGNYVGFDLRTDGTADKRITFKGEAGAAITTRNAATPDGINLEGADYVTIEGFTVSNMPRAGIRSVENKNVVLRNNTANANTGWGVLTAFSDDLLIEGNTITGSKTQSGIHLSNSGDRPVVRNNTISGNYLSGLYLDGDITSGGDGIITGAVVDSNKIFNNGTGGSGDGIDGDGVQGSTFQNNLIYGNRGSGVSLYKTNGGGASSGNKLVNNTIVNPTDGKWALNLQNASTNTTVLNNVLLNRSGTAGSINVSTDSRTGFTSNYNAVMSRFTTSGTSNITLDQWRTATGQDKNSIVATPEQLFVNAAGNDYHLSDTSLAWDKGTATNAPNKDFEGTVRPQGAAVDIGADERTGTAPTNPTPTPEPEPTPTGTKYVSPTGNDANAGTATSPWKTLQKAADSVQPGDTVIVKAGNYAGFDLRRDGTADKRITFKGEAGAAITSRNAKTPDGINLEGADYVTVEGFTISSMPRAGIRSVLNNNVVLRNNTANLNTNWGILTAFSNDLLIEGNTITGTKTYHGIHLSNSGDRPVVRGNTISGNRISGIYLDGDVTSGGDGIITGAVIEANKIFDNGAGGGSAIDGDGVQNSLIQNNLVYNNHRGGITLFKQYGGGASTGNKVINNTVVNAADGNWALNLQSGSINTTVLNNVLYSRSSTMGSINISPNSRTGFVSNNNAVMGRMRIDGATNISLAQWQSSTGQDKNSLVATPEQLFVNAAGNDYHLSDTSPAWDKGTATNAPTKDFEGTTRPQGAAVDIGADERTGTAPTNPTPTPEPEPTPTGTKYVSTTGNDANDGSAARPWRTLQKAANTAQPGDTVIVKAGNYVGFYMDRDGTAAKPITFKAEPGAAITSRNATTPDGINLEGADYINIEGFTVNNMPRAGIRSVLNHHITIRNNKADSNGVWGIFTGFASDVLIEGNVTSRSVAEHGIYFSNSGDRPIIRNNISWGNNFAGIHMNGDIEAGGGDGIISDGIVEGNIIYDNGRGGASAINADGVQNTVFQNNLLYNNHASGISLFKWNGAAGSSGNKVINNTILNASDSRWALNIQNGSTNNTVLNNIIYNAHSSRGAINISADSRSGFKSDYNAVIGRFTLDDSNVIGLDQWRSSTGQDRNSFVATPSQLFVNAAGNDYHLSSTSPALDKGTTTNAPNKDFEGTARPQGSGIDIGADERVATSSVVTNVAPTLTGSNTVGYTLNSAAIAVANSVKLLDPDTVSYNRGTLNVRITSGIDAGNRLSLGGSFRISDGTVKLWDGKVIGTISGDMKSSMTITLGSNATRYWTEQLVKSIRFRTVDSTSLAPRMLELQVNDGNGGLSNKLTNTINVQS